jgi:hypothetical protein
MSRVAVLLLALIASQALAATAYVSDELILGVFAEKDGQGQRLATLHSGAGLETLGNEGEYTQVRLADGITGWVKSSYLTLKEPAVVRLKHLEEDLERSHASPPGEQEAAARHELEQLRETVDEQKKALAETRAQLAAAAGGPSAPSIDRVSGPLAGWLPWAGVIIAGALGFWLGYATLARKVRVRFGGIKVY